MSKIKIKDYFRWHNKLDLVRSQRSGAVSHGVSLNMRLERC